MFSVALSVEWTCIHPPGRYPAHCSAEFGLSSLAAGRSESDRPVQLPTLHYIRSDSSLRRFRSRGRPCKLTWGQPPPAVRASDSSPLFFAIGEMRSFAPPDSRGRLSLREPSAPLC